ncbi:FAD-dependent oxygenase [Zalerion maritima]|uniref:FAD-dependent oxygenase n=1 Tax=Zalerion maritima TaxID=339359 RepID=A0AAD5RUQ6_9PEZI|nr:FAD-dependent oxygenase [Zalerion maritima]
MMHWRNLEVLLAAVMVAWAVPSSCLKASPVAPRGDGSWIEGGVSPRANALQQMGAQLSAEAEIYFPWSDEFDAATTRWSVLEAPKVNVVVVPGTAEDVALTIKFANKFHLPFLAYNSAHGAITTLGRMNYGIEIYLSQLSGVEIAADGQTATIGGGTLSKVVTDALWDAGKQTVTGTCECVSALGPALGGGHGWLQGRHGLVADQFVSMDIVLANGTLTTIDESSDLWWAVKGAGHNFGIVTSVTSTIYDIEHSDWAIETLIFTGDKVEEVYQAANDHLLQNGTQPVDIINWSYWLNNPDADPENPVILFWIIQEGVTAVDSAYLQPFLDIGPIVDAPDAGTYLDLAAWTGISADDAPCQKAGLVNPRFPTYLKEYDVAAQREAYDLFASSVGGDSVFNNSLFMFEGYSTQGVKAVDEESAAFAFREDNLLTAPLLSYVPDGEELDEQAKVLGNQLRQILRDGSGSEELHAYVNYAYGDETVEQWYGYEEWRQEKLAMLKEKYDPEGKFSFFGPIA